MQSKYGDQNMKIHIIEEKEAPLYSRKEYVIDVDYTGPTPSRAEMTKHIAKLVKADSSTMIIKKIDVVFGHTKARSTVYVYSSADIMKKVETKIHDIKADDTKEDDAESSEGPAQKKESEVQGKEPAQEEPAAQDKKSSEDKKE